MKNILTSTLVVLALGLFVGCATIGHWATGNIPTRGTIEKVYLAYFIDSHLPVTLLVVRRDKDNGKLSYIGIRGDLSEEFRAGQRIEFVYDYEFLTHTRQGSEWLSWRSIRSYKILNN